MKKLSLRETAARIGLVLAGLILALILSEIILTKIPFNKDHSSGEDPERRYIWQPNLEKKFDTPRGKIRFSINSNGIRGDEFSDRQNYHILAVGASSTECFFLDNKEAWPYLIQKFVNDRGYRIWVGNIGRSGRTLANNLVDSAGILDQFPFVDAMILMPGINDLSKAMVDPMRTPQDILNGINDPSKAVAEVQKVLQDLRSLKAESSPKAMPFYKKTSLWKFQDTLRKKIILNREKNQGNGLASYAAWAKYRKKAPKIDVFPDLSMKLYVYRKLLNGWIDLGRHKGVRLILATQPTLWREDLSEKEQDVLWFGWAPAAPDGTARFFSVKVLRAAMDLYNLVLLDVCRLKQVECVDLASLVPKDPSLFYDDCHLNEKGALKVAQIFAKYLLEVAPVKLPAFQVAKNRNGWRRK